MLMFTQIFNLVLFLVVLFTLWLLPKIIERFISISLGIYAIINGKDNSKMQASGK